jgi:hypothetical protein
MQLARCGAGRPVNGAGSCPAKRGPTLSRREEAEIKSADTTASVHVMSCCEWREMGRWKSRGAAGCSAEEMAATGEGPALHERSHEAFFAFGRSDPVAAPIEPSRCAIDGASILLQNAALEMSASAEERAAEAKTCARRGDMGG